MTITADFAQRSWERTEDSPIDECGLVRIPRVSRGGEDDWSSDPEKGESQSVHSSSAASRLKKFEGRWRFCNDTAT
jgi:hypothetical protein